jgi:CubicO group peptidase (beta-lactamase class C family)
MIGSRRPPLGRRCCSLPAVSLAFGLVVAGCIAEPADPVGTATPTIPDVPVTTSAIAPTDPPVVGDPLEDFVTELEALREVLGIPGMSVAVVEDGAVVWAGGFGFADVERRTEATADTSYHLASVTKPIAATMIMQLVEEGLISLDDPIGDYGIELEAEGEVQIRHLLTHTSEGIPGAEHRYNGDRFSLLGDIAEAATGVPYRELMFERVLEPAGMTHSAGNRPGCGELDAPALEPWGNAVRTSMASPYQLDGDYRVVRSSYPGTNSPSAGLIASATDVAAFDLALDAGTLLGPDGIAAMFAPMVPTTAGSDELAYGLGWYSQHHDGTRIVWHSGHWPPSVSALYVKVPDLRLSFVVLANTPNLTTPFPLGKGDVLSSALALEFYREFVFPRLTGMDAPAVDWSADEDTLVDSIRAVTEPESRWLLERRVWARRQAAFSVGLVDEFDRLTRVYDVVQRQTGSLDPYLESAADPVTLDTGIELTAPEMERLIGVYELDPEASTWPPALGEPPQRVVMRLEAGILHACAGDEPLEPVVALGDDRFRVGAGASAVEFAAGYSGGLADRVIAELPSSGIVLVFTRVME